MNYRIYLRTRKPLEKTKRYSVELRCGKNFRRPLGIKLRINEWSQKSENVTRSCDNYESLFEYFAKLHVRIRDTIIEHSVTDPEDLWFHLTKRNSAMSVADYLLTIVNDLEESGRYGNAKAYRQLHSVFNKSVNGERVSLKDFSVRTVERFDHYLTRRGLRVSTRRVYMSTMRAAINRAIKHDIIEPFRKNPFEGRIKAGKPNHRAISLDQIQKLRQLKLVPFSEQDRSRDYWLLMFNLQGMNLVDLAHMEKDVVGKQNFGYIRRKMRGGFGEEIEVAISNEARTIMKKYEGLDSPFLLPIIKQPIEHSKQAYTDYSTARRNIERGLKGVAAKAGIENLTTYMARHSWATIADTLDVDRRTISRLMGHNSLKTTEGYIQDLKRDNTLEVVELISGNRA